MKQIDTFSDAGSTPAASTNLLTGAQWLRRDRIEKWSRRAGDYAGEQNEPASFGIFGYVFNMLRTEQRKTKNAKSNVIAFPAFVRQLAMAA